MPHQSPSYQLLNTTNLVQPTSTVPQATAPRTANRKSAPTRVQRDPLEPMLVDIFRTIGGNGLVLTDIYRAVVARGGDYPDPDGTTRHGVAQVRVPGEGMAWKKNVRHILTVRDFFVKTGVKNPDGRGQFWVFDDDNYRDYLAEKRRTGGGQSETCPSNTFESGVHQNRSTPQQVGRSLQPCFVPSTHIVN